MARKLRLQYAGAVYHVISRGNYRAHVFADERTKEAFLTCLHEACVKAGWVVHAWCVMSNHYHLCVETPQPNLVEGMRWLQATFAIRFNRFRDERGHLFQGRYKALLVAGEAVGPVCHYIHLNPVRAKVIAAAGLATWQWTSVRAVLHPRERQDWLDVKPALLDAGGLADTPAGRRRYLDYLGWLQEDEAGKKELAFDRMSEDWAVGTRDFKKDLIRAHRELEAGRSSGASSVRELAREMWAERLGQYLAHLRKTAADVQRDPKGAPWKAAVAAVMKQHTTASNPWLAEQLRMGSPFRLSRLAGACRRDPVLFEPYVSKVAKCKV